MFAHLKDRLKKDLAPFRRHFLGNKYASGDYLNTTPVDLEEQLKLEPKDKLTRAPRFIRSEHEKEIEQELNVVEMRAIGSGSYGIVYEGKEKGTDKKVALKVISAQYWTESRIMLWKRMVRREMYIMNKFPHDDIVELKDYMWIKEPSLNVKAHIVLKLEFLDTTLAGLMERLKKPLTQPQMAYLGKKMGAVLSWLHDRHIVHHDIRPGNIMVGPFDFSLGPKDMNKQLLSCPYKLIDLSYARMYEEDHNNAVELQKRSRGYRQFMSPQKKMEATFNPYLADSFAFGTTLLASLMGNEQFIQSYDKRGCVEFVAQDFFADIDKDRVAHLDRLDKEYRTAIFRLTLESERTRLKLKVAHALYFKK